nr:MAG TPA: hypothetical protein [Caudoviricetes sp.]
MSISLKYPRLSTFYNASLRKTLSTQYFQKV